MQLLCPSCGRVVEYTSDRPSFCAYCGQPLPKSSSTQSTADYDPNVTGSFGGMSPEVKRAAPTTVGGYRLIRLLGSGGMGTVYEAEDPRTRHRVAVKLIAREEFARSEEAVERFRREGRLASTIAHPRCVFVLNADEDAGQPYIVMELMSGPTLKDVLEQRGPLPPEEAIARILDVIEGLQEAHRLQVIHRDVKPSNCFLDVDGRVKVGDFGLSKSLDGDVNLTQTGHFLGTRPFASPEQHKGQAVDVRSDIYSVCATLYCLLTGHPPFSGSDGAAIAARVASEEPPSVRSHRPDIAPALDAVILRGLARDREKRWQTLDELRNALQSFIPTRLSYSGLGLRIAAYLVDWAVFTFAIALIALAESIQEASTVRQGLFELVIDLLWITWFTLSEGWFGCSPGKWLFRLRVYPTTANRAPGLKRALGRTLIFFGLVNLGFLLSAAISGLLALDGSTGDSVAVKGEVGLGFLSWTWAVIGLTATAWRMRASNGFQGLHDLWSNTRVVQLARPRAGRSFRIRPLDMHVSDDGCLPERLGPYLPGGVLWHKGDEALVWGDEAALGRRVLIWIHPCQHEPVSAVRRQVARTTRLRWLTCGQADGKAWDAFVAPLGVPIRALASQEGPLTWTDARPILEQIIEELEEAEREATIPKNLGLDHLWIQANGRVQILDFPIQRTDGESPVAPSKDSSAGLEVVCAAATILLEGQPRSIPGPGGSIRAPLPQHARDILDPLVNGTTSFRTPGELREAFEGTRTLPTQVDRAHRIGHLVMLIPLMVLPLFLASLFFPVLTVLKMEGVRELSKQALEAQGEERLRLEHVVAGVREDIQSSIAGIVPATLVASVILPVIWILWAMIWRGGFTWSLMGLMLVDQLGRPAPRWRCGLRALLIWLPIAAVFALLPWCPPHRPSSPTLEGFLTAYFVVLSAVFGILLIYLGVSLWKPGRSVFDRLAGIHVVPR